MSTNLEMNFRDYNWVSLLKGELPENKFLNEERLLIKGVRSFSDKFSPSIKRGFFKDLIQGKTYLKRDKKDAIKFIVDSRLVKNEEEATNFIETFKNRYINYLMTGSRTGEYFKLIELKNVDGMSIYQTDADKSYFDCVTD